MKTQTRITLLLAAITLLFAAGFIMLRQNETHRELLLIRNKIFEKNTLFDRMLRLEESSLEMFTYDASTRDEVVRAASNDRTGRERLASAALMPSFNVSGLWLCDTGGNLIYAEASPELQPFENTLRSRVIFPQLFATSYFCHFFMVTPQGLLEIRSAPVQPAWDIERSSPPRGFLFAGRLWNPSYIQQLSSITESSFDIIPIAESENLENTYEESSGIIGFYRIIYGWNKHPVAQLRVRSEAPIAREMQRTSKYQLILLFIFVSAVILLLSVLLILWVNLPLKRISESLHQRDPGLIGSLVDSPTEFGNLARLVLSFFKQQQELTQEIGVRKQAEDALRVALHESQRSGAQTAALLQAARSVLTYHDFPGAAQSILSICIELAGAAFGFIAQITSGSNPQEKKLRYSASILPGNLEAGGSMLLDGLFSLSCETREPRLCNDMAHLGMQPPTDGHLSVENVLCAPLILAGEVLAILALGNKPAGFNDSDLRMASAFSELAAVALLNSRTLESLEASEERFRSVVQTASDAIISADSHESIVFWNRAAEAIFGYTAAEAIGKNTTLLLPPEYRAKYQNMPEQNMPSLEAKPLELTGLRKDGTQFQMEVSRSAWRSREGVFFTAIVRDISSRIELEHLIRLQEKMASLGRVTAGIAHEIRNPLTGINTYLYSLRNGIDAGVPDQRQRNPLLAIAGEIQNASDKIEGVIRRVMDFAKPGMPKFAHICINHAIEEAVKLSAATLRKNGIVLRQELSRDLPDCRADQQMIEQVILNLITNAIQAMQGMVSEKILQLRSWSTGEHVLVTVADSGPGIPASERGKIFDPFYTNKSDGSGIGLSLCQRIATDHRGSITVETSCWGGAQFRFELPAVLEQQTKIHYPG